MSNERALLDFDGWVAEQDQDFQSGVTAWLNVIPEAERAAHKQAYAADAHLAEVFEADGSRVSENRPLYRRAYAQAKAIETEHTDYSWEAAAEDEGAFQTKLLEQATQNRSRRYVLEGKQGDDDESKALNDASMLRWAVRAANAGQKPEEAFQKWQENAATRPEFKQADIKDAMGMFRSIYDEADTVSAPYRQRITSAYQTLKKGMESTFSTPVRDAFDKLGDMTEAEFRQFGVPILQSLAEADGQDGKGFWKQMRESFARPVENAVGATGDFFSWFGAVPAGEFAGADGNDVVDYAAIADTISNENTVKSLLRSLADSTVDPVIANSPKGWRKTMEQAAYDTSGSLGHMAVVAVPYVGMAASTISYQDQNFSQMLLANPTMSPEDARLASSVAAPFQMALDRVGLKLLKGQLPTLWGALSKPGGSTLARLAGATAANAGFEFAIEKAQDALPLLAQDALAGLKTDVPHADWSDYNLHNERIFWAVLPLSLIGAGVNTHSHVKMSKSLAGDAAAMKVVGIQQEKIDTILAAPDPVAALRSAWNTRDVAKTPEEAATRAAEYMAAVNEAQLTAQTTLDQAEAADIRLKVKRTDGGTTFQVTEGDTATDFTDGDQAFAEIQARLVGRGETDLAERHTETVAMVKRMAEKFDEAEVNFQGKDKDVAAYELEQVDIIDNPESKPEDIATAQNALANMGRRKTEYESKATGPVDWSKVNVAGRNKVERQQNGMRKAIIDLSRGATPKTVAEEFVEAEIKDAIGAGKITVADLAAALKQVEALTGDAYLTSWTDGADAAQDNTAVIEAFSDLAQIHAIGQRRRSEVGKGLLRGEDSRLRKIMASGKMPKALMEMLEKAVEWVAQVLPKAMRLKRARGKHGGKLDIDQWLDKALGIDQDQAHAQGVREEAGQIFDVRGPDPEYVETDDVFTPREKAVEQDALDASYLAAVKAGDLAEAQKMVDEAAKKAGYDVGPVTHATNAEEVFSVFRKGERAGLSGKGIYFATDGVGIYGKNIRRFYLKITNPLTRENAPFEVNNGGRSAVIPDVFDVFPDFDGVAIRRDEVTVKDPNQIKSADAVTYDDAGNVIPLSKRFDASKDSINFSLAPAETLDQLAENLGRRTRDPEARRKVFQQAKDALSRLRIRWATLPEKLSAAQLNKRAAVHQAFREEELVEAIYAEPSTSILLASQDLANLWNGPVMSQLRGADRLHGLIMSKTRAIKEGKVDPEKNGDFDGIDGLPRIIFGGARMPDQVAQDLYDSGVLTDAHVETLWNAIRKEVATAKNLKEQLKALDERFRAAKAQAKAETEAWVADQEAAQSDAHNSRDTMLRNLRTLNAILSAFPPEVRAKVGGFIAVAKLKTQVAMSKEISRRIEKLDTELESALKKAGETEIRGLVDKAKPEREAGKKPKGKLGAETHRFFDKVAAVLDLTEEAVAAARLALQAEYGNQNLTDAMAADIFEREQILDTFGALGKPDGHNADHLYKGLAQLEAVYTTGKNHWKTLEEMRLQDVKQMAGMLVETFGKGSEKALQAQAAIANNLKERLKNGATWDMYSGSQIFDDLLGENHPLAHRWKRQLRDGTNATVDSQRALKRRWKDAMKRAFGGHGMKPRKKLWKMATENTVEIEVTPTSYQEIEIPIESIPHMKDLGYSKAETDAAEQAFLALPTFSEAEKAEAKAKREPVRDSQAKHVTIQREIKGDTELVSYTEAQAIAITMLHDQEQYRLNLLRVGWNNDAITQLEAKITDQGKILRDFMRAEYKDGYTPINLVFERMFGVALPQIKGYSPASFWNAGQDAVQGPEGDVQNTGFRATALKSRTKHKAEPKAKNAFALFFAHHAQMAHWQNNAEFARELRGVFGNPEVKKALISRFGEGAMRAVTQRIESIEGNGIMQAYGEMDSIFSMVAKWKAYAALAWNMGTAMVQATAATAVAFRMSPKAYMIGLGKLVTGQLNVREMFKSETIQRRMESMWGREVTDALGQTIAAPTFLQGPGWGSEFAAKGIDFIGNVDAVFTSIGAAIYFDHAKNQALKQDMTEADATAYAERETSQVIFETAQPQTAAQKSNFELRNAGYAKVSYMFMSDARKNTAHFVKLLIGANDRNRAKALLIWPILGVLTQAIRNVWQDARDDDDDELLDPENWTQKEFLFAAFMGPVNGIPILGESLNKMATGYGSSGVADNTIRAMSKVKDLMETTKAEERDKEKLETTTKDALTVLKGLNASIAVPANVADQAFRSFDNFFDDEEEQAEKDRKAAIKAAKQ